MLDRPRSPVHQEALIKGAAGRDDATGSMQYACVLLLRKRAYLVVIAGERRGGMIVTRLGALRGAGRIWHRAVNKSAMRSG